MEDKLFINGLASKAICIFIQRAVELTEQCFQAQKHTVGLLDG
jgi:hypothetical protein